MKKLEADVKSELRSVAKELASQFRSEYPKICKTPILNSFKAAEELGFFVVSTLAPEELSGLTETIGNKSMIVVNSRHPLGRQNYSIWHEIYHWYSKDGKDVSLFKDIEYSETEFKAEAFAAEILLEEKALESELKKLGYNSLNERDLTFLKKKDIVILQNRFKVSYRAVLTRLIILSDNKGLNNRYGAASTQEKIIKLNQEYGFDGRLEQPTEKPYVSESLFNYLSINLEKGKISREYVEQLLEFVEGEIE